MFGPDIVIWEIIKFSTLLPQINPTKCVCELTISSAARRGRRRARPDHHFPHSTSSWRPLYPAYWHVTAVTLSLLSNRELLYLPVWKHGAPSPQLVHEELTRRDAGRPRMRTRAVKFYFYSWTIDTSVHGSRYTSFLFKLTNVARSSRLCTQLRAKNKHILNPYGTV